MSISLGLWIISSILINIFINNNSFSSILLRIWIFLAIFSSGMFHQFILHLPFIPRKWNYVKLLSLVLTGICSMLSVTPWMAVDAIAGTRGFVIIGGPIFFLFPLHILLSSIASVIMLVISFRNSHSHSIKLQLLFIFIGFLITVSGIIISHIVLPLTGIRNFKIIGSSSCLFLILLSAYAILRHNEMHLEKNFHKLLIEGISVVIVFMIIGVIQFAAYEYVSGSGWVAWSMWITGMIALSTGFTQFLIPLLSKLLSTKTVSFQIVTTRFINELRHLDNPDKIISNLENFLKSNFKTDSFAIYQPESIQTGNFFYLNYPSQGNNLQGKIVLTNEAVIELKNITYPIYRPDLLNEDSNTISYEISLILEKLNSSVMLVLKSRNDISGLLTIARRETDHHFSSNELNLINVIISHFSIALNNAQIYKKAIQDGLTGLYNHSYFKNKLYEAMFNHNASTNNQKPFCLTMIDIDRFKLFNDNYGHLCGDYVLKKIAEKLIARFSSDCIIGRYGGEEFAIMLFDRNISQASMEVDEFRKEIAQKIFRWQDINLKISISAGVCQMESGLKKDVHRIIERADSALYTAKSNGRNQVCRWSKNANFVAVCI